MKLTHEELGSAWTNLYQKCFYERSAEGWSGPPPHRIVMGEVGRLLGAEHNASLYYEWDDTGYKEAVAVVFDSDVDATLFLLKWG